MKLTIDMLRAVEALHKVRLIHGDIKADNLLLRSLKDLLDVTTAEEFLATPAVVLTDFGCGINLDLFPSGTRFSTMRTGKTTAGYEILSSRPWTYHVDYYGVLDVMHSLLFNDYMRLYQEGGTWRISKSFKRSLSDIWAATFTQLLNLPADGSQSLPCLTELRRQFEARALHMLQDIDIERFSRQMRVNVFMQRKSCFVGR